MSEAAIEFTEEDKKEESRRETKPEPQKITAKKEGSLKDFSLDKLNQLLDKAITNEDYERAARIRDEINKRN